MFLCRDKHSDAINFLTCHPPTVDVLRRAGHLATQIVPEPHQGWHPRCKEHDLLRHGGCITVNRSGEAIISELDGNCILMISRHVPAQVKVVAGRWGGPARAAAVEGDATKLRLSFPFGLAMFTIEAKKNEVCYFTDAGNNAVRLLRKAHNFKLTQTASPVAITSEPPLQPFGLACISRGSSAGPLLVVSEEKRRRVVVVTMDASLVRGHVACVAGGSLLGPAGLAVCGHSLYVADTKRVLVGSFAAPAAPTAAPALALHVLRDNFEVRSIES